MSKSADIAMRRSVFAVNRNVAVALFVSVEGPLNTLVWSGVTQCASNDFFACFFSLNNRRLIKRISMTLPTGVVTNTQATGFVRQVATFNDTHRRAMRFPINWRSIEIWSVSFEAPQMLVTKSVSFVLSVATLNSTCAHYHLHGLH